MYHKQTTAGFTLIEMIVSLALFSVVVTISVGALLVLIASNRQLQDEQAVLTNLSFALDSMTREIRTGSAYACGSESIQSGPFGSGNDLDNLISPTYIEDCADGRTNDVHGISFVESGDSITGSTNQRIIYFHDSNPDGNTSTQDGALYRRFGSGDAQKITSDSIAVVDADFFVTGAESLADGESSQPAVTIYIEAQVAGATNPKTYPIQTTVVQRGLDL